jgi:hypothetical protein
VTALVHVLVPEGIDDPARPSGGNTYDRRLCDVLRSAWSVDVVEVPGGWPWSAAVGGGALERALRVLPDRSLVVVDGMLASGLAQVMVPASDRLRVVLLMHMPVGDDTEGAVVRAAAAVIAPSEWCRTWLVAHHRVDPRLVQVALPGVDAAAEVTGSRSGDRLLSVGTIAPGKGQDVLLAALGLVTDLAWSCTCIGADQVAPDFVARLRHTACCSGLHDRFLLAGPRSPEALAAAYAEADVLVLASRAETYGMVVTEALARGLPVIASDVGGLPEALGPTTPTARTRPGILVPPEDATALADALRAWLTDADLRQSLRSAARQRRAQLQSWAVTGERVDAVLRRVAA